MWHRHILSQRHYATTPLLASPQSILSFGQDVTSCPRVLSYPAKRSKSCSLKGCGPHPVIHATRHILSIDRIWWPPHPVILSYPVKRSKSCSHNRMWSTSCHLCHILSVDRIWWATISCQIPYPVHGQDMVATTSCQIPYPVN